MKDQPGRIQFCTKPELTAVLSLGYFLIHVLATVETEMKSMSPAERVQTFINQMVVWEAGFHAEKKSDHYKHSTEYRCRADADAKARLIDIFSENLSAKSLNTLGAARLETLGTGRPPEYDQTVLMDTENRFGTGWTVETRKTKGINQRYQYILNMESGTPKISGVNVWRNSAEKWEHRNAI